MTMSFLILAIIVTVSMVGFKPVVRTAIPPLAVVSKDEPERVGVRRGILYSAPVDGVSWYVCVYCCVIWFSFIHFTFQV